ncbi:MAG: DUF1127 domain-containing protein [Gemmobacter sp.]
MTDDPTITDADPEPTGAPMTSLLRLAHLRRPAAMTLSGLLDLLAMHRSRRSLNALDDHILRDIGLTREQAQAEADRAAWDVSPTWRR